MCSLYFDKPCSDDQQRYVVVWDFRSAVQVHFPNNTLAGVFRLDGRGRDTAEAASRSTLTVRIMRR